MIKLTDINSAVNTILEDNFPDCKLYTGKIDEGFERPSFFVKPISVLVNYDTVNFASNKVMVEINYFTEKQTEIENLIKADELKKALGMNLIVSERHIPLDDIRINEVDGVLQFKFTLNYYDNIEKDLSEYEIMRDLNLNKEG